MSESPSLRGLIARAGAGGRVIATQKHVLALDALAQESSLGPGAERLKDSSVLLAVGDMALAAAALIELDGRVRRLVLAPPGWDSDKLASAARTAQADSIVHDGDAPPLALPLAVRCQLPMRSAPERAPPHRLTEWVLPTSGTSGPPKLVAHDLATLTGAIGEAPLQQWATFYDIRRYGGLQIFLRALSGRGSLFLNGEGESVDAFLDRLAHVGLTHMSGTPSHWRKALMSGHADRIHPGYVRLSGEIADDAILDALAATYPRAHIEHAYASTEAGVAFAVDDRRAGFPAAYLTRESPVELRVVDGALQVRSARRAHRFLGPDAPALVDAEGFVDTGDMVVLRGDRYHFAGRRGGIVNVGGAKVHPEEVEATLNAHPAVRASRVYAKANPVTGALVMADVVLRDPVDPAPGLDRDILAVCRQRLAPHMVPVRLRFVTELAMTDGGKLARNG